MTYKKSREKDIKSKGKEKNDERAYALLKNNILKVEN